MRLIHFSLHHTPNILNIRDPPLGSPIATKSRRVARTDVGALNGGLGGSETQTDILVPSSTSLARSGSLGSDLGVLEDVRLLLESALRLDGQLGRPGSKGQRRDCSGFVVDRSS